MKKIIFLLAFAGVLFPSCATILSGTSDKINFRSEPSGATVYLDGTEIGKTNNDIEVKRKYKSIRKATYKKEGYFDLNFDIPQKITPAYWLGIFSLFSFMIVDIIDGAALQPRDKQFEKTLEPKK